MHKYRKTTSITDEILEISGQSLFERRSNDFLIEREGERKREGEKGLKNCDSTLMKVETCLAIFNLINSHTFRI